MPINRLPNPTARTSLFAALLPTRCLLCQGSGSQPWCADCIATMPARVRPVQREGLHPGWAAFDYQGSVRELLHWFKSTGSKRLAGQLAVQLGDCLERVLARGGSGAGGQPPDHPHPGAVLLVPMPSRFGVTKQRGYVPAWVLARAVGALRPFPVGITVEPRRLVWFGRRVERQARLGREDRSRNLHRAMSANPAPPNAPPVVLLDDVVTTGATLREATRALTQAGWQVIGFITFAETL